MRKFYDNGILESIEYGESTYNRTGCMFRFGCGDSKKDYMLFIGFFKYYLYITFTGHYNGLIIHKDETKKHGRHEYRQRSLGIVIDSNGLNIGHGMKGQDMEGETTKTFFYSALKRMIFGKRRFLNNGKDSEITSIKIFLPDLRDPSKTMEHDVKYRHVQYNEKQGILKTKKRIRTNIEIDPPFEFPGKGTTSYNCGDDSCGEISICEKLSRRQVAGVVAKSCYESRKRVYS